MLGIGLLLLLGIGLLLLLGIGLLLVALLALGLLPRCRPETLLRRLSRPGGLTLRRHTESLLSLRLWLTLCRLPVPLRGSLVSGLGRLTLRGALLRLRRRLLLGGLTLRHALLLRRLGSARSGLRSFPWARVAVGRRR